MSLPCCCLRKDVITLLSMAATRSNSGWAALRRSVIQLLQRCALSSFSAGGRYAIKSTWSTKENSDRRRGTSHPIGIHATLENAELYHLGGARESGPRPWGSDQKVHFSPERDQRTWPLSPRQIASYPRNTFFEGVLLHKDIWSRRCPASCRARPLNHWKSGCCLRSRSQCAFPFAGYVRQNQLAFVYGEIEFAYLTQ
jgi:hypothetical protein